MKSKKDPNYIAAVEKAITEKYGKNTVQDFRSSWDEESEKNYLEQLKSRSKKLTEHKKDTITISDGEVEIKRSKKVLSSERTCPVCKTYSFSRKDDLYMNRFQCCHSCYVDFIEDRLERWNDGWRPDSEHIEICLRRRKQWQQS
jgi:CRISPR/Cas system-associated endoribonuclease Cas2